MSFTNSSLRAVLGASKILSRPLFGHNLAALQAGFSTTTARDAINNVTVFGGGLMGAGIAQVKRVLSNY